jgi:Fe-S cluster assembly protein SufD
MPTGTQNKSNDTKAWLETLFRAYEDRLNGHADHPLVHLHKNAMRELAKLDFPTRRDEDWKYTPVNKIFRTQYGEAMDVRLDNNDIEPFLFEDLDVYRIVFINGIIDKQLSSLSELPPEVQVSSLSDALTNQDTRQWVEKVVQKRGGTDKNTFLELNRAFTRGGLVIRLAKNYQLKHPIHLLYITRTGEIPHFAHPQLFVKAERSSDLTVLESHHALDQAGDYFNNVANWIEVGENARVRHYRVQLEGSKGNQVHNTIVDQNRESTYTSFGIDLGGLIVRNNLSSTLLASGTRTNFYGTYLMDGNQHIDNQTFIDHAMPHCDSNELFKGILAGRSRGVFNGKVMVRQDAQKTNAFQQNSSLVLSPDAVMDAKPQLEIFADDVRCSHGATIGQLDEASVFYLMSRGIPEKQARNLLQQAFIGEVLEQLDIAPVRSDIERRIEAKLNHA